MPFKGVNMYKKEISCKKENKVLTSVYLVSVAVSNILALIRFLKEKNLKGKLSKIYLTGTILLIIISSIALFCSLPKKSKANN